MATAGGGGATVVVGAGGGGATAVVGAAVVGVVDVVVVEVAVVEVLVDGETPASSEVLDGADRADASSSSTTTAPMTARSTNEARPPSATASHGHLGARGGSGVGGVPHGAGVASDAATARPHSCSGGYHLPSAP